MTLEDLVEEDEKLTHGYVYGHITDEEYRKRKNQIDLLARLILGEEE